MAGIDHDELTLLKFSKSEVASALKWKHSKEFKFKGEMYDVVSKTETVDSIFFYCWWDKKETALNVRLQNLTFQLLDQQPFQKNKQKQLQHWSKQLFYTDRYIKDEFIFETQTKRNFFYDKVCLLQFYDPHIPPPKV
ncbi:hypothetical protein [Putridiphycobacter roseus]|nr:hypothetical protein [Putridiphycobacter roseus]